MVKKVNMVKKEMENCMCKRHHDHSGHAGYGLGVIGRSYLSPIPCNEFLDGGVRHLEGTSMACFLGL